MSKTRSLIKGKLIQISNEPGGRADRGTNFISIQPEKIILTSKIFFYNPNNSAVSKCNCNVTYNTDSLIPFADSFLDSKAAIPNISVQSQQENRRGRHVTQQFKDNINTHQQPKL